MNSLRDEKHQPIFTYSDPFMRNFIRQSIKGGRCSTSNQCYKFNISDEAFNIKSEELNAEGNVCEIVEKYFEKTEKKIEDNDDSQIKTMEITVKKKEPNKLTRNLTN